MDPVKQLSRDTIPVNTGPPSDWKAEAARAAGNGVDRAFDLAERPRSQREPRPRASTLAVVALVLGVANFFAVVGVVTWHQSAEAGYERREQKRHDAVIGELTLQRSAIYAVIDVAARHHPEAAQVGVDLSRTPPPSVAP